MRRAVVLIVLAPAALALLAPTYWEVGVRLAVGALGAVGAWALSRPVWTVVDVPRELAPVRAATAGASWPAAAERVRHALERAVPRAQADRVDRARGLRRTCRAIAAERLHAHHGIDLARDDQRDAARSLLGLETYDFLEGGPMIDHERLVDALERL
ncbi:MAG: hypothetical protein QOD72_5 [Acidimicrobiaceae bacterium]|jgi:hypothetical protein|nr:hypothetical protein [Acidimicrobiaceae bacterium]